MYKEIKNYNEYLIKCYDICVELLGSKVPNSKIEVYRKLKDGDVKTSDNFAKNLDNLIEEYGISKEFSKKLHSNSLFEEK